MKVLHTIGNFRAKDGGTSSCTYDLLSAIHNTELSEQVDILTPDVIDPNDSLMGVGESWIKAVPNDYHTPLFFSVNMTHFLKQSEYDIYHTNGLWMHINHITCAIARKKGKRYIITPHGMLYPEAMERSYWKKWPLKKLWFNKDIREASAIHVTCEAELMHIRNLGYNGPIALIGNPVNVPIYTEDLINNRTYCHNSTLSIAFLGRLHPIKKVENILRGVALSRYNNTIIYILGEGENEYVEFLKTESARLNIDKNVHFLGFLNGKQKYEQLANVDALFVPSDMENFGMIIPEALIVGTPVMASLGTPWEVLNTLKCGWWTNNSPQSIAKVIDYLYSMSAEDRQAMGIRGRKFILDTFASDKIASQMIRLYRWINGDIDKPDFVYCR